MKSRGYDPNRTVRGYAYDMDEQDQKNVERYLRETNSQRKLKKVDTPFLDESREPLGCAVPEDVEPSQETSVPTKLPPPTAPSQEGAEAKPPPQFNTIAAGIIMQTMYAARMARPDALRACGVLSTYLTKCCLLYTSDAADE